MTTTSHTTSIDTLRIAERRLIRARTQLLVNPKFVFWATCALHLKFHAMPGMVLVARGPIGTDGVSLVYDPDWIAGNKEYLDGLSQLHAMASGKPAIPYVPWTDEELMGVVAHEVSHAVKGDIWRRGSRDPGAWNIAADRRINAEMEQNGLKLPDGGVGSARFDKQNGTRYQQTRASDFGQPAEALYEVPPPKEEEQDGNDADAGQQGMGNGDPMAGDLREGDDSADGDGNSASAAERQARAEALQRQWELIARQAAATAKAQGHLPSGMEHLIEPIRPQLDPWAMLRYFVQMCRAEDFSWSRGNRRHLHAGLYLPSLYSEGVGELIVAVDTSGSTAAVLPKFIGFLNSVLVEVKPARVWFVECDAAVHKVTEFGPGDELPERVEVHGFGGTSMRPVWEWAATANIEPVCAIVLTDGEMSERDFGLQQGWPCLWVVSTKGIVAPWGETVELGE